MRFDAQVAAQGREADARKANDRGGDRTRGLRIKSALPIEAEEHRNDLMSPDLWAFFTGYRPHNSIRPDGDAQVAAQGPAPLPPILYHVPLELEIEDLDRFIEWQWRHYYERHPDERPYHQRSDVERPRNPEQLH